MNRNEAVGRRASVATTDTAEHEQKGQKPMSAPILPKVAGWTPARVSYRRALLAFKMSLRWLPPNAKAFSYQHFCIYQQFTGGVYPYFPVRRVWEAARQDAAYYMFAPASQRWVHVYQLRPGERIGK